MKKNKIILFIEGLLLIILGSLVMSRPVGSVLALTWFITWFLIAVGLVELLGALFNRKKEHKTFHIVDGIVLLTLGILFLIKDPIFSAAVLVYATVFWFIISSFSMIALASKTMNGAPRLFIYVLNLMVIGISIYSLFNPGIAAGIFVFSLSFNFFLNGFARIMMIFAPEIE